MKRIFLLLFCSLFIVLTACGNTVKKPDDVIRIKDRLLRSQIRKAINKNTFKGC